MSNKNHGPAMKNPGGLTMTGLLLQTFFYFDA